MSKHHTVELSELQDWLTKEYAEFAFSTKENKRLICHLNGNLEVLVGGKSIWLGTQPYAAAEAYNSVTEKWVNPLKDFKI